MKLGAPPCATTAKNGAVKLFLLKVGKRGKVNGAGPAIRETKFPKKNYPETCESSPGAESPEEEFLDTGN